MCLRITCTCFIIVEFMLILDCIVFLVTLYNVIPFQFQISVIGHLLVPTGYTARMAGFFLYVSNTTSKYDGHLCFHEIQTVNRTPSEDQRINCSVHGRHVIYYNERRENFTYPEYYSKFAYYELCELEVYGEFLQRQY